MIKVRIVRTSRDGWILKWKDGFGKTKQARCVGTTQRKRESERLAKEAALNNRAAELSWNEFWTKYHLGHLVRKRRSKKHVAKCKTMHKRLAEAANAADFRCSDIGKALLLDVETNMAGSGVEESTITSAMNTLWSMIGWGQDHDLIPDFRRPRRRSGKSEKQITKSKGRALATEEVERLIAAIPLCCKPFEPSQPFIDAVNAARYIGMRLSELWDFSWEPSDDAHYPIRLNTPNAVIEFSNVQKSGISSTVPLTNEAIKWLRECSERRTNETKWVCRTSGKRGPHQTPNRLARVISEAGRKAGIVVKRWDKGTKKKTKCATLHDLRRTFATNLQRDLTISEKVRLTRHADAQTLLNHYEDVSTPELIAKLRG